MEHETCNTCAHYRQHYAFNQRKIFRVYCGHCTYRKTKTKRLSKKLLEYMLKLELLPEILGAEKSD